MRPSLITMPICSFLITTSVPSSKLIIPDSEISLLGMVVIGISGTAQKSQN
tara:strand:- start:93 stop:245 length:153 start_codon:yes stop_codon:yes gene_type:complete